MKIRQTIAASAIVLAAMGVSAASAATIYTYTGNPGLGSEGDKYYVSATADLNCTGSCAGNTYAEGAGLISFTLSIDNLSHVPVFSMSSSDSDYSNDGVDNYLTLSSAGVVTNWQVYADDGGINTIYTIGNDPSDGTGDLYAAGLLQSGTGQDNPGTWSAVPEPATWAMFLLGFGGIGFMMRSSRRKGAVAMA